MCLGTSCSVFSEEYLFALETPCFIYFNHKGLVESLCLAHRKLKRLLGHFSEATITRNYATGGMSKIRAWLTDLRPCLRPWTPHEVRCDTELPPGCPLTSLLLTSFSMALTRSAAVGTSVEACRAASREEDCKTLDSKGKAD